MEKVKAWLLTCDVVISVRVWNSWSKFENFASNSVGENDRLSCVSCD